MASTVTVDLNANLARFTSQIDKATNDLNKFQSNAARMSANINKSFGALGVGLSVGIFGKALAGIADFQDEMGKAAQRAGTTAKAFSELAYSAELSDVEVGTLEQALGQLSKKLDEAKGGSKEAGELFKRLKIDPKQFTDSADALKAVADRFNELPDGTTKTALAKDLGKAWMDLIPLLNEGSKGLREGAEEAARFGKVVDDQAVDAAQRFNDNLTRLNSSVDGLKFNLGTPLISALANYTTAMLEATKQTNIFFASIAAFNTMDTNAANVGKKIEETTKKLGDLKKFRDELDPKKNFANKLNDFVFGDVKGLDRQIEETQAELNVLLKMQKDINKLAAANKSVPDSPAASGGKPRKTSRTKGASLKDFQEDFLIDDLQSIGRESEQEAQNIARLNEFIADSFDEEFGRIHGALDGDEAHKYFKQLEQDAASLHEATRTPLEQFTKSVLKVKELYETGLIDPETAGRALQQLHDQFAGANKQVTDNLTDAAKDLGLTFSSAFEDAIVGGKELSEVLQGLEQDISRIITRRLVTEPLADWVTGQIGGFDFGELLNANGNAFDQSGLIPFANGGVVNSATPFSFGGGRLGVMGEAGSEAILPLKRGADGKLGVQGGGTTIINQYITTPDANSFRKSESQVAASMQRALNKGRRVS